MRRYNHYHYLEDHLIEFLKAVGVNTDIYHKGLIGAHGDKAYGYRDDWRRGGLHFFHGTTIFLLAYCRPYAQEVRETERGWVDAGKWVLENKDRFLPHLPPVPEDCLNDPYA